MEPSHAAANWTANLGPVSFEPGRGGLMFQNSIPLVSKALVKDENLSDVTMTMTMTMTTPDASGAPALLMTQGLTHACFVQV